MPTHAPKIRWGLGDKNETRELIAYSPNSAQLGAPPTTPPSNIRVRAILWAYGRGQTNRQTRETTIHFASSTTHAKCNDRNTRMHNCDSGIKY